MIPYYRSNGTTLYQGHVLDVLAELEAGSVQCAITSPPYWGLRDYGLSPVEWPPVRYAPMSGLAEIEVAGCEEGCEHEWGDKIILDKRGTQLGKEVTVDAREATRGQWCQHCSGWRGSLGLEPTLEMYVGHLVLVFREARRVLRDDGVLFVNLGDSYTSQGGFRDYGSHDDGTGRAYNSGMRANGPGLKPKDLCGIPWRVAFALQADGWYLRSAMPWVKKSAMPESVRDRPTAAHEYVFLLTKRSRYFYDAESIKVGSAFSFPARRTDSTSLCRSAIGIELVATLYTNDETAHTQGWCNFGDSQVTVNSAVARDTERFQIIEPVSLDIGIKIPEGHLVVNLDDAFRLAAPLTSRVITFSRQLSLYWPIGSTIANGAPSPCGAVLTSHIDSDPFSGALARAKVMGLECTLISNEFFAACIALECEQGQFTLFVWTFLWSSHVSFSPDGLNNIILQKPARRNYRTSDTFYESLDLCIQQQREYLAHLEHVKVRGGILLGEAGDPVALMINPAGFKGAHFATFPPALVEPMMLAGTSERGCCPECKTPWLRVVERTTSDAPASYKDSTFTAGKSAEHEQGRAGRQPRTDHTTTIDWRPGCDCGGIALIDDETGETFDQVRNPYTPIPCTVLDFFAGSGTTADVCREHHRDCILIELSREYCDEHIIPRLERPIQVTLRREEHVVSQPEPIQERLL